MNWSEISIMPILAGLGLFLFGMYTLEEALRGLAGRTFKKIMQQYTNNPVLAVLVGVLITILVQSSSMISLLVMSFVGAGIIGLRNGIGVILGANIGTTGTSWIITFIGFKVDMTSFVFPFLAIGGMGALFPKTERIMQMSKLLMGFSFIFLGLTYMKNGFVEFAEHIDISIMRDRGALFFVLIGLVLSATIQASSATMMILMSSLSAGLVTLEDGFYVIIGSDVGTTMTAVIGTLNGNSVRKKVGWSHVLFNIFNAIIAFPFVGLLYYLIQDILKIDNPFMALAFFHTLFNIIGVIALLPFIRQFTWLVERVVPTRDDKIGKYITLTDPKESHSALRALDKESRAFMQHAITVNAMVFQFKHTNGNFATAYEQLKAYETEIVDFYMEIQQGILSDEETRTIDHLAGHIRQATLSAKCIKDIKGDLDMLSGAAADALYALYEQVNTQQQAFYTAITQQLSGTNTTVEMLEMIKHHHQTALTTVQQLFAEQRRAEMDMPTLQNMLHLLRASNEALAGALPPVT